MENRLLINFCRLSYILLDTGSTVLSKRINVYCDQQSITFEQFLIRVRHDLFHMWQVSRCCQCKNEPESSQRTLFQKQFDKLYDSFGQAVPGHKKKGSQVCACHILPRSDIRPEDLDISLASSILLKFCNLKEWEKKIVIELRDLRNEILGHPSSPNLSDEDFNWNCSHVETAILGIAKGCGREFHQQICKELTEIKSKPITDTLCGEQLKMVWQHYASSKCLFEEIYDVLEMTRKKCREIPEKLQHIIEITEPVQKEVADDMRFISTLLSRPALPDRNEIKRHFRLWLRQLHEVFPEITTCQEGIEVDTESTTVENHQGLQHLRLCSIRENNIACTNIEIDAHGSMYVRMRAVEEAEKKLSNDGTVILIGKRGSGKSTHALELLNRARNGNIFPDKHDILHLSSIDDWDHLVIPSKNTLIYLDDPIGKTTANVALIQNDGGIFKKIWACVKEGKVKVIMTIRSTIVEEYAEDLNTYELFHSQHMVDLSNGDLKINTKEKKELVDLYCQNFQVKIVKSQSDENIESGEILKHHKRIQIAVATIQKIIQKDPPVGFPLCSKNFFRNKMNTRLGLRYFNKPTEALLKEMESLALSKNPIERCQFVILVLAMFSGGHVSEEDLASEKITQIGRDFDTAHLNPNLVKNALKKLKQKSLLNKAADDKLYKYCHDTTLEAVFNVYTCLVPNRSDVLIRDANKRIIYEMVRTEAYEKREDEEVLIIGRNLDLVLVKRFILELKQDNIREVILHPAMKDDIFRSKFFKELTKSDNLSILQCQDHHGHSLFTVSCLFDQSAIVRDILEITKMSTESIHECLRISLNFYNSETIRTILPFVSQEKRNEAFIFACNSGTDEVIKVFLESGDKYPENVTKEAFSAFCLKGRVDAMRLLLLQNKVMSDELIIAGFPKACESNNVQVIKLLLEEVENISADQIERWLIHSCFYPDGQKILEILFYHFYTISSKFVSSIFKYLCSIGNNYGIKWILDQDCLSTKDAVVTLIQLSNNFLSKDTLIDSESLLCEYHMAEPSTCLIRNKTISESSKLRSQSLESLNSKSSLILHTKNLHRQRSISETQNIIEDSCSPTDVCSSYNEEWRSKTFTIGDKKLSAIIQLLIGKRLDIDDIHLRKLIESICENGKLDCLKITLSELDITEEDIVEGLRIASRNHQVDIVKFILHTRSNISTSSMIKLFIEACELGIQETVQEIVKKSDITQLTIIQQLEEAASKHNVGTVSVILKEKIYLPMGVVSQLLSFFCKSCNIEMIKLVLDYRLKDISAITLRHCFLRACKDDNFKIVNTLLMKCGNSLTDPIVEGLFLACKLNKSIAVKTILLSEINLSKSAVTESIIIACLSYSIETIEIIKTQCKTLPLKNFNQVLIVCLNSHPSLVPLLVECRNLNAVQCSKIEFTGKSSHHNLSDSELLHLLLELTPVMTRWYTNTGHIDTCRCINLCIQILAMYGESESINHILRDASYVTSWWISKILQSACKHNRFQIVHAILENQSMLSIDDALRGVSKACECESMECLECILNTKKDIPESSLELYFSTACSNSKTTIAEKIIQSRKDLTQEFIIKGLTTAVINQKPDVVKILLQHRLDVCKECISDLFQKTCENGNTEILMMLMQYGEGIDYNYLIDCFLKSCIYNSESVVETVIKTTQISDHDLLRGLDIACRWDNRETLEAILKFAPTLPDKDIKKQVVFVCLTGKAEMIITISNLRCDMRTLGFLKSCEYGRAKVVKKLLHEDFTLNTICKGINIACRYNQTKVIALILQCKKELKEEHVSKNLILACREGKSKLLECFLRRKQISTSLAVDCFELACKENHVELASVILSYQPDLPTDIIQSQLEIACENQQCALLRVITERVPISATCLTKSLNRAFGVNSLDLVLYILRNGQQLSTRDFYAGLVWLGMHYYQEMITDILKTRVNLNSSYVHSTLIHACNDNNMFIMEKILNQFERLGQEYIRHILKIACSHDQSEIISLILRLRPKLNTKIILHVLLRACEEGDPSTVDVILKLRHDLSKSQLCQIFYRAIELNRSDIIGIVLDNVKRMSLPPLLPIIEKAYSSSNIEIFGTILSKKPEISDEHVVQKLFKACENNNTAIVRLILEKRNTLSTRQLVQVLVKATKCDNDEIIKLVLQARPSITSDEIERIGRINRISDIRSTIHAFERITVHQSETVLNPVNLFCLIVLYLIGPFMKGFMPVIQNKKGRPRHKRRKKRTRSISFRRRLR